jgi:hypothetical protein
VLSRVKIESGLNTIYELSDDSDSEVEVLRSESKFQATLSLEIVRKETTLHVNPSFNLGQSKVVANPIVIHSLMRLGARKWSKTVLSRLNFDAIKLQQVDYLPPRYDANIIFEFPPLNDHG